MIDRRSVLLATAGLAGCAGRLPAVEQGSVHDLGLISAVVFPDSTPLPLSERMRRFGVAGAQVTVMREGRVALRIAQGKRSASLSELVDARTQFQAASLSKPVTALGALRLVASGAIGLDEDVRPRLGSWRLNFAEGLAPRAVTLRQLLSHTAGASVPSFPGFDRNAPAPSLREILDGAPGVNTPRVEIAHPSGAYRYSGGGYEIIEHLIEQISGRAFTDYMHDTVLAPARMRRSTFALPDVQNIASGHDWVGVAREGGWLNYPQHAAASLWSNADDLALLLHAVTDAYHGARNALLPQALAREALTEVASGTGLGFGVSGEGDAKIISHAGWNRGYRSYIAAYPERREVIAVMASGDRGNEFIMEVLRGAARRFGWPGFQPQQHTRATWSRATRQSLPGEYGFEEAGFSVVIESAGDDFILRTPRGADYTLAPVSEDTLISIEDGETIRVAGGGSSLAMWGMVARRV
jgi:CubicO group peptidase (beta-lactamase class C family)